MRSGIFLKDNPHYCWVVLSNTTLGMFVSTINSSIVLISLPAIFTGINLNPLELENVSYLLWILMGYMLVTVVFVVMFGHMGDQYGCVQIYNVGFALLTVQLLRCVLIHSAVGVLHCGLSVGD